MATSSFSLMLATYRSGMDCGRLSVSLQNIRPA